MARKSSKKTPKAPPRASRDRQRQRLIDACISALYVHGPSHTTVERVTAIAKMSPGIVRFYFESKAAMLVASLQFLADEFEQQLLIPVARMKHAPVAALQALVDLYLDSQLATPRKVSVWYSFWGEASSRAEYYELCGNKDANFAALTRELVGRVILESGRTQLDPDGVSLGLIGVLEVLWQDIAFQDESRIDRNQVKRRAMAYLHSVFPGQFGGSPPKPAPRGAGAVIGTPAGAAAAAHWQLCGHVAQLTVPDARIEIGLSGRTAVIVRDARSALDAYWRDDDSPPPAVCERDGFIFLREQPL